MAHIVFFVTNEYGGAFASRDGCPADKPASGDREGQRC